MAVPLSRRHSIKKVGVRGIYLGNYVRWDPKAQHEQMILSHAYSTASFLEHLILMTMWIAIIIWIYMTEKKFSKHGYSKVTDHACREIRHGRITREEGYRLSSNIKLSL